LQWTSISLVVLGGILQVGKLFVDRQEKELTREVQELKRKYQDTKVSSLETEILNQQSRIIELNKSNELSKSKVDELSNPYIKPIRTATVTVQITIDSNDNINFHYMDQGGYFGLGKGDEEVITMAASNCWGNKTGDHEVTYKGIYNLDASHKIVGSLVYNLTSAKYAQMWFAPMKHNVKIIRGFVICTINDSVQMRLNIPPHQANGDKIIIPNIKEMFVGFHN